MLAEFEEKEYESHLNGQLADDNRMIFPPGQVLENTVGFDAALYAPYGFPFWPFVGESHRDGVQISLDWWDELDKEINHFLPFKFNLFIQHKRPEYMKIASAKQWDAWGEEYYRYNIREHQQEALEDLETQIRGRGLVYHASPVFHTKQELWDAIKAREVVEQSNFAQPSQTADHDIYTYVNPGSTGVGFSDPEPVESTPLEAGLADLAGLDGAEDNRQFLIRLGEQVQSAIVENEKLGALHSEIVEELSSEGLDNELATALIRIDAFRFLTDSNLLIGVELNE
jgi:hypothetical protein